MATQAPAKKSSHRATVKKKAAAKKTSTKRTGAKTKAAIKAKPTPAAKIGAPPKRVGSKPLYWLFKSEPDVFSWDDLKAKGAEGAAVPSVVLSNSGKGRERASGATAVPVSGFGAARAPSRGIALKTNATSKTRLSQRLKRRVIEKTGEDKSIVAPLIEFMTSM